MYKLSDRESIKIQQCQKYVHARSQSVHRELNLNILSYTSLKYIHIYSYQ